MHLLILMFNYNRDSTLYLILLILLSDMQITNKQSLIKYLMHARPMLELAQ